jgi:hypothetical protein
MISSTSSAGRLCWRSGFALALMIFLSTAFISAATCDSAVCIEAGLDWLDGLNLWNGDGDYIGTSGGTYDGSFAAVGYGDTAYPKQSPCVLIDGKRWYLRGLAACTQTKLNGKLPCSSVKRIFVGIDSTDVQFNQVCCKRDS